MLAANLWLISSSSASFKRWNVSTSIDTFGDWLKTDSAYQLTIMLTAIAHFLL
jgi:hypothetical protein